MSSTTWLSRALPRTVVMGIVGATVLLVTALAAVAESWIHASRRSEAAQVICAFFAVTLVLTAVSLVLRTKRRLLLAGLSATALIAHGFGLVGAGAPLGVLLVGVAPLAYAFAKASTPPSVLFHGS